MKDKIRCGWVPSNKPTYIKYHDKEWGVPVHDDYKLFEFLILEGAQAGLSWETVLNKQENYKEAFDNFDFEKIAKYNESKITQLLTNEGIIRNKLKVRSAVKNAQVFIQIRKEFGSFDKYLWKFVDNKPLINKTDNLVDIPAKTDLSDKISKDLKSRGMNFVGSTIVYAFMQATGVVNDHQTCCFRSQISQTH